MHKILVATDFTKAAQNALDHASLIAEKSGYTISLLHVVNSETENLLKGQGKSLDELQSYMEEICEEQRMNHSVLCEPVIKEGSIFTVINHVASDPVYVITLMGTHGTKGLRQAIFGADVLKIARKSPVPVIAFPDGAIAHKSYEAIIFPYGGHEKFENKTKAVGLLAKMFGSEVHFYSVDKPSLNISAKTRENIEKAGEYFESEGIVTKMVSEDMKEFSIGFAGQTMEYAKKVGAQIIAVMSTESDEYSFISTVDKEKLINNHEGIAIMMTGDY